MFGIRVVLGAPFEHRALLREALLSLKNKHTCAANRIRLQFQ
jgi:hypothetical protein